MTLTLDRPATCLPRPVGAGTRVPLVTGVTAYFWTPFYALSIVALLFWLSYRHIARIFKWITLTLFAYMARVELTHVPYRAAGAGLECVGEFVGARQDDVVVLTRNTTDALNLLATAVPGSVLCLDVEHHANLLPWRSRTHRTLPAAATVAQTLADLEAALQARPTALLTVTGASNVTGEVLPLDRIAAIAHGAGARVAVDAAQLAPHRRVDLAATGVDYVALSGHKLYARGRGGAGRAPRLARRRDALPRRRGRGACSSHRQEASRSLPRCTGTRRAPRTSSALPRSPRPAGSWRRCWTGRGRPTRASCWTGSRRAWRRCRA